MIDAVAGGNKGRLACATEIPRRVNWPYHRRHLEAPSMNKIAISLIVLAALVVAGGYWYVSSLPVPQPPPEVDGASRRTTQSGDVVGFIAQSGARAWLGVRFASPPVGQRRWQAPKPPQPAGELIEALEFGAACPQLHSQLTSSGDMPEPGRMIGDEDCLYLNIWSPPNASGLPVMLWIHGGGNTIGHGGNVVGANLAAARQVVVVSINYRLGPVRLVQSSGSCLGRPRR